MTDRISTARRQCAACRAPVEDAELLCPQCHRAAARRKIDLLEHIARRPSATVDDLVATTSLTPVDIVNIAGDGRSAWRPPADDRVPVCVVCAVPTNSGGVCNPCTRRLEGRAAFA